jgi:hypothetical protein
MANESPQTLLDESANHVASLLVGSPNDLGGLLGMPCISVPNSLRRACKSGQTPECRAERRAGRFPVRTPLRRLPNVSTTRE